MQDSCMQVDTSYGPFAPSTPAYNCSCIFEAAICDLMLIGVTKYDVRCGSMAMQTCKATASSAATEQFTQVHPPDSRVFFVTLQAIGCL